MVLGFWFLVLGYGLGMMSFRSEPDCHGSTQRERVHVVLDFGVEDAVVQIVGMLEVGLVVQAEGHAAEIVVDVELPCEVSRMA